MTTTRHQDDPYPRARRADPGQPSGSFTQIREHGDRIVLAVVREAEQDPATCRVLTLAEAIVIVAFLVVGAVLLALGKPIGMILALFAGVGAAAVPVLARRIPRLNWR